MKRKLVDEIDCGSITCVDPHSMKKCKHLGSIRMGTIPICLRFRGIDGGEHVLEESAVDHWRLRCQQCLDAEVSE